MSPGRPREGRQRSRGRGRQDAASVGGTLESFDFAFGDDDFFVTVDLPSNAAAAAVAMTVAAAGGASPRTVVLLTPRRSMRP